MSLTKKCKNANITFKYYGKVILMNERYKYILTTIENEYDVDTVLRENERVRISSYTKKSDDKARIVLISAKGLNEAVLKKLIGESNKHLPQIYDVCSSDEDTVILEEYIPGCRLSDILSQKDLSSSQAVKYCIGICDALEFLHSEKIVHRDIKPSNVIINPNDEAVLIDLQAARLISQEHDNDTSNLGTVGYAAPEQFGIVQSMPTTDIYALGVMLNEMLTGQHPSVKTPDGKLGRIVEKCTYTQMSKRYQSVGELKKDLLRYTKLHK